MKRIFLALFLGWFSLGWSLGAMGQTLIKPAALKKGDTVGLIASAFRAPEDDIIQHAAERLRALGLKVKYGRSVYKRFGYLAGNDNARAADVNAMFADPTVKAIFEIKGGWGSARMLSKINYALIKKNPKILIGFSDITSLLLAIYTKTGLVTFHGPIAGMSWPHYTTQYLKQVLFEGDKVTFKNPVKINPEEDIIQTKNRIQVIRRGTASGPLMGGNLTILTSLLGSEYVPNFNGAILFVEDVDEDYYKIDRMMSHLQQAGVLKHIAGFVFGQCIKCTVGDGKSKYGTRTLMQILNHYIKPLGVPAWYGAMIGHMPDMFIMPEGVRVRINASRGSITMLESAVES